MQYLVDSHHGLATFAPPLNRRDSVRASFQIATGKLHVDSVYEELRNCRQDTVHGLTWVNRDHDAERALNGVVQHGYGPIGSAHPLDRGADCPFLAVEHATAVRLEHPIADKGPTLLSLVELPTLEISYEEHLRELQLERVLQPVHVQQAASGFGNAEHSPAGACYSYDLAGLTAGARIERIRVQVSTID
jgi:hypothetical protein